jgi:hypothetical protein
VAGVRLPQFGSLSFLPNNSLRICHRAHASATLGAHLRRFVLITHLYVIAPDCMNSARSSMLRLEPPSLIRGSFLGL